MKTPILMNREGVIASQNRHLNRSLYSIPYPVKLRENIQIELSKSEFSIEEKDNVPAQIEGLHVVLPTIPATTSVSTTQQYFEKYDIPITLEALGVRLPTLPVTTTVTTKLEASIASTPHTLEGLSVVLPSVPITVSIFTTLNVTKHTQKADTINVLTKDSYYEIN